MLIEKKLKCQMEEFKQFRDVNKFTRCTGSVASVLVKNKCDYYNLSTTVPNDCCKPSVNTYLDRCSLAYCALQENKCFMGKVKLFGKKYYGYYLPYFTDDAHCVVVALFVGIPVCEERCCEERGCEERGCERECEERGCERECERECECYRCRR